MLDCPQIGTGGSHCRHYDEETPCCWCEVIVEGSDEEEDTLGND